MKNTRTFLHGGFSRLNIPQPRGVANHQSLPNIETKIKNLPLYYEWGIYVFCHCWSGYLSKKIGKPNNSKRFVLDSKPFQFRKIKNRPNNCFWSFTIHFLHFTEYKTTDIWVQDNKDWYRWLVRSRWSL